VTAAGAGTTYTYDPNGNLSSKTEGSDTWGYEWNARNELTRVTKNSIEQARFAYDPTGRRVEKIAGGLTIAYAYDRVDILRETASDGSVRHFVHGPGVDEPLARDDSGSMTYYHADSLGSIEALTSSAGVATLPRRYDVWGSLQSGQSQPGYAFTAREWDPETSLAFYRARYYSPETARFISEDPIGLAGGLNRYLYASANPVRNIDPFGFAATPTEYDVCGSGPFNGMAASVCCRNGSLVPCFNAQEYNRTPHKVRNCMLVHEYSHMKDYIAKYNSCQCNTPRCVPFKMDIDKHDGECIALMFQYQCLKDSGPWENLDMKRYEDSVAFRMGGHCGQYRGW
jgi:RHS repeat-associated protein